MLTHSKDGCGEFSETTYLVHWYLGDEGKGQEEVCLYGPTITSPGVCGREVNSPHGRDYCERCMRKFGFLW